MKRFFVAAIVMAATLIAAPSPASAAATCSYAPSNHEVTVTLIGSVIDTISRDVAGHIKLGNTWCGGAATVTNTAHIEVTGDLGTQSLHIDLANKGFKPGFGNEPGTSDEIEFTIGLGAGEDALTLEGTSKADKIDLGQNGALLAAVKRINLNAGESTHVDADVSATGIELFAVIGKGGNDVIRARGLRDTGPDPLSAGFRVYGGYGDDTIKGGAQRDELHGDFGKDKIWGFEAADTINLSDGAGGDVGYGGAAIDNCACDSGDTFNQ